MFADVPSLDSGLQLYGQSINNVLMISRTLVLKAMIWGYSCSLVGRILGLIASTL